MDDLHTLPPFPTFLEKMVNAFSPSFAVDGSDKNGVPKSAAAVAVVERMTAVAALPRSKEKQLHRNAVVQRERWHEMRNADNVVARLMGLDCVPSQRQDLKPWCSEKEKHNPRRDELSDDKRMSLVRQKFSQAKRLASDEKLLHSKELQEALQFLSTNKDLFLKFLDEPNSIMSQTLHDFAPNGYCLERKKITVLKPSDATTGKRGANDHHLRLPLYTGGADDRGQNRAPNQRQTSSFSPPKRTGSKSTRIVLLKPTVGICNDVEMMQKSSILQTVECHRFSRMIREDRPNCSAKPADDIGPQIHKCMQMELGLSSSPIDGAPSDRSESVIAVGSAEVSSDLEFSIPYSVHSEEIVSRVGSPCSASCSGQVASSQGSLVREAKRRISERWSMSRSNSGASNSQEQSNAQRDSSNVVSTLGDLMLKSPNSTTHGVEADVEELQPTSCLMRSKSAPISLVHSSVDLEAGCSDFFSTKCPAMEADKKPASFGEKLYSLFFPRTKKLIKGKSIPSSSIRSADNSTLIDGVNQSSSHFDAAVDINDTGKSGGIGRLALLERTESQPSPISILNDSFFIDRRNGGMPRLSEPAILGPQSLSRSPPISSSIRSLNLNDSKREVSSPNSWLLSRLLLKADEDQDTFELIQKLTSFAILNGKMQVDWHPIHRPLCSSLLEKCRYEGDGDDDEVEFTRGGSRMKERLIFDAVNEAIEEIGRTAILTAACQSEKTDNCMTNSDAQVVAKEIWYAIRNWSLNQIENCVVAGDYDRREDERIRVTKMVQREMTGRAYANAVWFALFDCDEQVCEMVFDDLVAEALTDLMMSADDMQSSFLLPYFF